MSEYETSAAIVETETSSAELAEEVHNRATQARIAAKEAALIAEAQPHLPSGAVQAGDTTTAARAEAQQASSPETAQQVHATAEHTKGVAEHAASMAHTKGPGVTGNAYDAVTQLRAKVEETTVTAVTEGQKTVQAATNAGANYLGQAKNIASSAISTAASYLPASLTGVIAGSAAESASAQGGPGIDKPPGKVPASSTELESGSHTVSSPYPATGAHAQQVAVNESK